MAVNWPAILGKDDIYAIKEMEGILETGNAIMGQCGGCKKEITGGNAQYRCWSHPPLFPGTWYTCMWQKELATLQ